MTRAEPVEPAGSAGWSQDALRAWLGARFGLRDPVLASVSAGNSRQIWIATDAALASGSPGSPGLLVRAQFKPGLSLAYSLSREAAIYAALNGVGARVAGLRGLSDDGMVLVMDVLPGQAGLRGLGIGERGRVLREFLACLGEVHAAGLGPFARDGCLFGRAMPASLADCVAEELAIWEAAMREAPGEATPLLEFGLRWLRENVPGQSGGLALVQGDAGPGNFLHEAGAVTGLIDWEFAHPGDPLEDMAWIIMRGVLDRVPEIWEVVAEHCAASGIDTSPARLGYFLALVLWKVMVIRHRMTGDLTANVGRNIYYRLVHQRMFVEVMAGNLGVPEPAPGSPPTSRETERSWLYDFGVHQLKDVALPAVADEAVRPPLAGLVRVLRYLKAWDASADWILGDQASGPAGELSHAIRTGELSCSAAFALVAPRVVREFAACAHLLGAGHEVRIYDRQENP